MQNNIKKNTGIQSFQENNYYGGGYYANATHDCVDTPQKSIKFSTAVLVAIIGLVADIIAICCGILELNEKGMKEMFLTYKLHVYLYVIVIIFAIVVVIGRILFELLLNKTFGLFLLKNNQIYKIKFKKCPICGESCGGRIKMESTEDGTFCVCHRDKTHKWRLEYDFIMKKI